MTAALEESYTYCRDVARHRARNFYYAFVLLPGAERDAVCTVYAFMRRCDDLSDDPRQPAEGARAAMERWRAEFDRAVAGHEGTWPGWAALRDTVVRYNIPRSYFLEMIDGVTSDLEPREFRTFDDLYRYCYRVASVAGLSLIHILRFDNPVALELAEKCGVAFQLTNILRDVREDAGRGRVYIPVEDLTRFGVSAEEVLACRRTERLVELLRFEGERAFGYYEESRPLVGMIPRRNRASLRALITIYRRLLERIEQSDYDVLARRIRVPVWEKCWIAVKAARDKRPDPAFTRS
jgi:phytoene synthase